MIKIDNIFGVFTDPQKFQDVNDQVNSYLSEFYGFDIDSFDFQQFYASHFGNQGFFVTRVFANENFDLRTCFNGYYSQGGSNSAGQSYGVRCLIPYDMSLSFEENFRFAPMIVTTYGENA